MKTQPVEFKARCKTCGKRFEASTTGRPYQNQHMADQALRLHVARSHTKTMRLDSAAIAKGLATKARRKQLREAGLPVEAPATGFAPVGHNGRPEPEVSFCPRCGLNLGMCRAAVAVALRHSIG